MQDALAVAAERTGQSPSGYPFIVSPRLISAKPITGFDPYLLLLLGSSLKLGGVADVGRLSRLFRKHFEDLVCWCLRRAGYRAEIVSEPRGERGLSSQLKPALREIAARFGEAAAVLLEQKVTSDDNDLGVDVIATWPPIDEGRSGRPLVLIQCATGPVDILSGKIGEKEAVFQGVWQYSFYGRTSVRSGATPDDLFRLEPVHWDRLSAQGWVLDRLRLVQLATMAKENPPVPPGLQFLWNELSGCAAAMDWRNGWRARLD